LGILYKKFKSLANTVFARLFLKNREITRNNKININANEDK
jgi:hypothetical protein